MIDSIGFMFLLLIYWSQRTKHGHHDHSIISPPNLYCLAENSFGIRTALPSNSPYLDQESVASNNDDSPTSSSCNKTFWFFADNPEERKSWIDTITNIIEELKESQTHLHLKVVKLIEQQNYNDVRQLILNGEYSKNASLHFTKEEKSTDRGTRSASIAPGLREEDLSDDEDEEQVLTTEEIRQLTQMGYHDRDTILHIAVKNQDLKLVKFLLERDVDFNKRNKLDQTALHFIPISNGPGVFDPSLANRSGNMENSGIPQLSFTGSNDNSASNSSPRSGGVSPRGISPRSGGILRPRDELLQMILEKKEQRKININQFDKNGGFTALNLAARENEMDLVTKLVYENADPNLENDVGWTPMHYAIYNQNLRMLEVLTKRGGGKLLACSKRFVEPHEEEEVAKYGNIKLEDLKKYGRMSPLDMILSMLANATRKLMNASLLNSFNDRLATPGYKSTPVIPGLQQTQPAQSVLQTINNNPSLSKLLSLAKTILADNTSTSLSSEDLENHLKQLSSDENLDLFMDHLFVAIQFAEEISVEKCNLILKTLTEKVPKIVLSRFDVGSTVSGMHSSTTFIHIAIRAKNSQALTILLNNPTLSAEELKNIVNECEKRAADGAEYTPLHNAMLHAPALTGVLLDYGADCHKRSGKDLPIFLAVQCKELPGDVGARIVQAALDKNEEEDVLNFSNSLGQSLLFFACQNSQLELVKKLIERGANSGAITNGNETVLSAAAYGGNLQVMEYLIDELKLDPSGSYEELYTENSYPPIHAATKNGNLEAVKLLVEKYGVSVNQSRHDLQMRPIHLCSISGKLDVAQYLVEKGCDCTVTINTREDKLLTPLHLAAGYGHPEIVKLLVEQGNYNGQFKPEKEDSPLKVDLNLIKTQNGVTSLELAMKRVQLNVVKYLCELGTVSDEHTLQLAIQSNNSEIIGWVEKRLGGNEEKNRHLKIGSFDALGLSVTSATPKSPQQ